MEEEAAFGSNFFEILGFDIMLDEDLKPHLLEVNHNPSFQVLSEVDIVVKSKILEDTIKLIHLDKSEILKSKKEENFKNEEEEIIELRN